MACHRCNVKTTATHGLATRARPAVALATSLLSRDIHFADFHRSNELDRRRIGIFCYITETSHATIREHQLGCRHFIFVVGLWFRNLIYRLFWSQFRLSLYICLRSPLPRQQLIYQSAEAVRHESESCSGDKIKQEDW